MKIKKKNIIKIKQMAYNAVIKNATQSFLRDSNAKLLLKNKDFDFKL